MNIGHLYNQLISWLYISRMWGYRCEEYDPDCPTCSHWKDHDELFNDSENDPYYTDVPNGTSIH